MTKQYGSHERLSREEEVRGSSDRAFGVVFAVVFAVVALWPLMSGQEVRGWSIGVAAVFLLVAFIRPTLLAPLNQVWIRFGLLLSRVTNPVIMGFLFYLVMTPMALVARLAGKDPLRLRVDRSAKSYWIERRPPGPPPDTMKNQF